MKNMFQWKDNLRNILLKDSTLEKETICQKLIESGYNFLIREIKYEKPAGWAFAQSYLVDIENYIMEHAIPGSYTTEMIRISADHAAFIADYGWNRYSKEMCKPEEVGDVSQFFYDDSFEDYDPKKVDITDLFKEKENDDDDDFDGFVAALDWDDDEDENNYNDTDSEDDDDEESV